MASQRRQRPGDANCRLARSARTPALHRAQHRAEPGNPIPATRSRAGPLASGGGADRGRDGRYYDSQNFRNLLGYDIPPSSCSGTFSLDPWRNKIESIRNRTRCGVYLLYFCGTTTCWNEWMRPFSEDGTINPLNAIDQVRFS